MKHSLFRIGPAWCAALLAITAFPLTLAAQDVGLVGEGARVYGNMCGRCHNPRSPLEHTDRSWTMIVNHMRIRANLTGKQVRSVLAFLQASNTDPAERANPFGETPPVNGGAVPDTILSTDPQVIARGRAVVQEGACLGCHVVQGQGGAVGPSLDDVIKRRGVEFVMKKMADPTFDSATSMMPNFG
ncbi:MAG: hypothetical protein IH878_17200, partial [Gemmatimonadetes bacterium]|nr:hypothetical protein [Gemmatimonadota bacterium]